MRHLLKMEEKEEAGILSPKRSLFGHDLACRQSLFGRQFAGNLRGSVAEACSTQSQEEIHRVVGWRGIHAA